MNSWLKTALCLYTMLSATFTWGGLLRSKLAERSAIPEQSATAEQSAKLAEQSAELAE